MLRVSLIGNLGADPEVKYSQKGTQIVSFRVAVNQVRSGLDGERQENTEWFRVRVANRQAEFAQRLTRGARVLVIGRLDISHYVSKDGEARIGFDVWSEEVQSMAGRATPGEADGLLEPEPEPEPAAAGVSSLASAGGGARATPNGKSARGGGRSDGSGSGRGDDLEDLPF